jgi:hypothetical protein
MWLHLGIYRDLEPWIASPCLEAAAIGLMFRRTCSQAKALIMIRCLYSWCQNEAWQRYGLSEADAARWGSSGRVDYVWPRQACQEMDNNGLPRLWLRLLPCYDHRHLWHAVRRCSCSKCPLNLDCHTGRPEAIGRAGKRSCLLHPVQTRHTRHIL